MTYDRKGRVIQGDFLFLQKALLLPWRGEHEGGAENGR